MLLLLQAAARDLDSVDGCVMVGVGLCILLCVLLAPGLNSGDDDDLHGGCA